MNSNEKFPLLYRLAADLTNSYRSMNQEALLSEIEHVTTKNCWWVVYGIALLIKSVVQWKVRDKEGRD